MGFKFTSNRNAVVKKMDEVIERALLEVALHVEGRAVYLVPVLTGDLRKTIDYDVDNNKVRVGVLKNEAGSEYAVFVERGTRHQKAQSFIKQAFVSSENDIREMVIDLIKRELI